MEHLHRIQKTFVRQLGSNDCGIACVCMLLKYAGLQNEAQLLRANYNFNESSLLDLRNFAGQYGLQGRCVEMELEFLSTNSKPCILHLAHEATGNHFQVCYGKQTGKEGDTYLLGDPARGIHYLHKNELKKIWVSKAALYFEDLPSVPAKQNNSTWHLLLSGRIIPTGLLFSIPLLSIFTATLGIAWSWALQRGMYNSIAEKETRLIVGMVLLLLLVTIAKNLFTYIRQQLMIRLNVIVNKHLTLNFIRHALGQFPDQKISKDPAFLKNGLGGMMKMQQAVSAFLATILSEGSILVFVLAALSYQSLVFGLINLVYLLSATIYTYLKFPELLFEQSHLNELAGSTEALILQDIARMPEQLSVDAFAMRYKIHEENHIKYLKHASLISSGISRNNLVLECLGTCCIVTIFIYGIIEMRNMSLSYSAFMIAVIFSYFISALMPKICNALFIVNEGIESSRHYHVEKAL